MRFVSATSPAISAPPGCAHVSSATAAVPLVEPLQPSAGALSPDGVLHEYTSYSPASARAGIVAAAACKPAASVIAAAHSRAVRRARFDVRSNTATMPTRCRSQARPRPLPNYSTNLAHATPAAAVTGADGARVDARERVSQKRRHTTKRTGSRARP